MCAYEELTNVRKPPLAAGCDKALRTRLVTQNFIYVHKVDSSRYLPLISTGNEEQSNEEA